MQASALQTPSRTAAPAVLHVLQMVFILYFSPGLVNMNIHTCRSPGVWAIHVSAHPVVLLSMDQMAVWSILRADAAKEP